MASENLTGTGKEAFFNEKVTFYKGVTIEGDTDFGTDISVKKDGINIASNVKSLNFTGNAVSSVNLSQDTSTVLVEMTTNIDGGDPDTVYGSITSLDGGSI